MMLRTIILFNLTLLGCAAQVRCYPELPKNIPNASAQKTICQVEERVLCYDRERRQGFTSSCQLGSLRTTVVKVFFENMTELVCDEGKRKWSYVIPFNQVCEIYQETVCRLK